MVKGLGLVLLCCAPLMSGAHGARMKTAGAEAPTLPRTAQQTAGRKAAQAVWRQHQRDMVDALSASSSPRDWMLAALIDPVPGDKSERRERLEQIVRAADAAPNDAVVQWTAALQLDTAGNSRFQGAADQALQRLQSLEPDNAAVWLQELAKAAKAKDPVGIDQALDRMAASTRVDEHAADLMQAIVQAYQRYPLPDEDVPDDSTADSTAKGETTSPYATAVAVVTASAMPAYVDLVRACEIDKASGRHAWRARDCAGTGRLLAAKGDTLIANRIGYAVLRVSRTYTDRDVANARVFDWLWNRRAAMAAQTDAQADKDIIARVVDWIVSGSEIDATRYSLARRGIALTPPADWIDEDSPFAAKRPRDDKRYAAKRVAQSY